MATAMPTYDYEGEQGAIARRQKLLEALMQGGLAPLETNLGPGVKQHPLAAVAKIAQTMAAMKGIKNVDVQRDALAKRYAMDGKQGLQQFLQGFSAQPGQEVPMDPSLQGPPQVLDAQGAQNSRRRAVYEAMASTHPQLRQVGEFGFKELMGERKGGVTTKDVMQYATPESREAMLRTGDISQFVAMPEYKVVADQIFATKGGTFQQAHDARETFGAPAVQATGAGGQPLIGQRGSATGKINWAPGGSNVTVNNVPENKAATAFATAAAEVRAKALKESQAKAATMPKNLQRLDEAQAALDAGIKSGAFADIKLALSKAFKALTGRDVDPTISKTEEYTAQMAQSVLAILQELRPASDKDVQYAEKAAGGKITLDEKAMRRLISSARAVLVNDLLDHSRLIDRNRDAPGADAAGLKAFEVPFDLRMSADDYDFTGGRFIPKPEPARGATQAAPLTWDEYKAMQRGGR